MNYLPLLNKDEQVTLCKIISGKNFKEYFKRDKAGFSKVQKGFRAISLTEQHALDIAIKRIGTKFISDIVNEDVDKKLTAIKAKVEQHEQADMTYITAVAKSLRDSPFCNNVELYLKLTQSPLQIDTSSSIYEIINHLNSENNKVDELNKQLSDLKSENQQLSTQVNTHQDSLKTLEDEKQHLLEQLKKTQHQLDAVKAELETTQTNHQSVQAEYDSKIQQIEQANSLLSTSLSATQDKLFKLESITENIELNSPEILAQFDDTSNFTQSDANANSIMSLCSVVTLDYAEQPILMRHADLQSNGHYELFLKDKDKPSSFENRDKIYYKDGPTKEGFYGIWSWTAMANAKNPAKDYIQSHYKPQISAIELVCLPQTKNLDQLVVQLKEGVNYKPHSLKVMFFTSISTTRYTGVLFKNELLNTINNITKINEECTLVPVYEFTNDDIMHLDNGLSFYRKDFAGVPNSVYRLKSPMSIVKDIVESAMSWNAYKTRNLVKHSQLNLFREVIGYLPVEDITQKIAIKNYCSKQNAQQLLDKFINSIWKYLDVNSLEDDIILSAVSANSELQKKSKALIQQDWEKENAQRLAQAQNDIELRQAELKTATDNLNTMLEQLKQTQDEEKRISCVIADKTKLAEDVEKAVYDKIQKARENAADFIANMAFVGGQTTQVAKLAPTLLVDAKPVLNSATYCTTPEFENLDQLDKHQSWGDVVNTAVYELEEAGVKKSYLYGFAAFLCAAYIEKQPLLLVGPNAIDIAQAFCAAVCANKHGTLYCEGSYDHQTIEKIGSEGENIVIINNLIASGWINRLPEIIFNKEIFYIATHPYAEDIQVEPKSLYSFMLPFFTEPLVGKQATGHYTGGYPLKDFTPYSPEESERHDLSVLSKFTISPLVKDKLNRLATTMYNIYPQDKNGDSKTNDRELLFLILPIVYASMATNKLTAELSDPQSGIKISDQLRKDLQFMLGEC